MGDNLLVFQKYTGVDRGLVMKYNIFITEHFVLKLL